MSLNPAAAAWSPTTQITFQYLETGHILVRSLGCRVKQATEADTIQYLASFMIQPNDFHKIIVRWLDNVYDKKSCTKKPCYNITGVLKTNMDTPFYANKFPRQYRCVKLCTLESCKFRH